MSNKQEEDEDEDGEHTRKSLVFISVVERSHEFGVVGDEN